MWVSDSKNSLILSAARSAIKTSVLAGFRITACAATPFQAALVLSIPKRSPPDETQETLRTSMFPSTHVKVHITESSDVRQFLCIHTAYQM